jgi:hypothetical protein
MASMHLSPSTTGASLTSYKRAVERLKHLSSGFPFLAEELLREAKTDFATSMLGSDSAPEELAADDSDALVSKDPYTPEEKLALDEFYKNYKRNAGWELVQARGGVEVRSAPSQPKPSRPRY